MWIDNKKEVLHALDCCNEFLCEECLYRKWDSDEYKLRCIHMLINDLTKVIKELI